MQPAVSYIPNNAYPHEQTGGIITFAQFEKEDSVEIEINVEECESVLASIDDSFTDNDYDDGYISKNSLGDIWYGIQIHPEINARYSRLKIHDRIKQTQNEFKGAELSDKSMGKVLHKLFKFVVR